MRNKYILQIALVSLLAISFTACGGGGDDASFKNSETMIPVDVLCVTPADISSYIPLQSGDVIAKEDDNTSVSIYHDVNGTKKICLESGTAHIIRN